MKTLPFLRENANWLGAGALLTFLSSFGQTYFISLFSAEIRSEFGLSDGDWGAIYGMGTLASATVMVWAGGLADKFRTRQLGFAVLGGLSCACLIMALNPYPTILIFSVFLLRFFGQGMASHTAVVAMSRWFDATRGRALAVCGLGFTFAEALFPILCVSLLVFIDWRLIWGGACLIALLGIPLLTALLKTERHPMQTSELMQNTGMLGKHWTRQNVLRNPLFWLMIPALLGPSAFNTAFFFHQVHFADIKGWSHLTLVAAFPIYTASAVLAMLISGRALDRFGTARLLPFYQVPMVFAFIVFSAADSFGMFTFGLVLLAITSGANATLPNAFWAEFYGTQHLGAIKSMATAIMVLGSAIGPILTGVLIDRHVELESQYFWVGMFFGMTTILMWIGIWIYRDLRK
ncbi:MAG: MFS transporter [Paracoccaceae bacterium]